jgi:hypothetical protein
MDTMWSDPGGHRDLILERSHRFSVTRPAPSTVLRARRRLVAPRHASRVNGKSEPPVNPGRFTIPTPVSMAIASLRPNPNLVSLLVAR